MRRSLGGIILGLGLGLGLATAQAREGGAPMHARGTFEVVITPVGEPDKAEGATLGRMTIDKRLKGDLEGTGKGQMLTAMADLKGSAGYVAVERIVGTLAGRKGSFVLQHTGTMRGKSQSLSITVVPDSGTGELAGIEGKFAITIAEGRHSYDFEYTLPGGQ